MVAARELAQKISGKLTQIVKVDSINKLAESKYSASRCWVCCSSPSRRSLDRAQPDHFAAVRWPSVATRAARLAGINIAGTPSSSTPSPGLLRHRRGDVTSLANAGSSDHGNLYELQAIAAAIIAYQPGRGGDDRRFGARVLVFTQISNMFVINNLQLEYQLMHRAPSSSAPCSSNSSGSPRCGGRRHQALSERCGVAERGDRRPRQGLESQHPRSDQEVAMIQNPSRRSLLFAVPR